MLPKKKRVTKDIFQTIMEKGNVVQSSFFLLRFNKQNIPQYAFVVPKKIVKTAVKRNLLRRKGYNILNTYNLKKDIGIFFYKKEGTLANNNEIKNDLNILLKKAKII